MHMANELLSPGVAAGTFAIAAGAVGLICHRAKSLINSDRFALMGIMGAFVFAAQMVHFPLPFLPGTSGHIVGAVLLAVMLGPYLAAIVLSSVVIVQCLIFQDGGLLALGCNIINLAVVPTFLGYWLYRLVAPSSGPSARTYIATVIACTAALVAGAMLITIQTRLSGVLAVPLKTFMTTMAAVHIIIGFIEGLITAAVVLYLNRLCPRVMAECPGRTPRVNKRRLYAGLLIASLLIGAGLSLLASNKPDGLEWSYAQRPDQPDFKPIVSNENPAVMQAEALQSKYSPLPNYTVRLRAGGGKAHPGWKSFAAVVGAFATMAVIWLTGWAISRRNGLYDAPCPN